MRAIPALRIALTDASSAVRRAALLTVARVPHKDLHTLLIPSIYDPVAVVRRSAVAALASLRAPETLSYLLRSLRDEDWTVRREGAVVLSHFPYPGSIIGLRRVLRDSHPEVLREAIVSLAKLHAPVGPAIVPFLDHGSASIRLAAVKALDEIGDPELRSRLVRLLNDRSPEVIEAALILLARPVEPRCKAA